MRKKYLILVAGGRGKRMGGGNTPKQFQSIGGLPIIMHTILKARTALPDAEIIVVIPWFLEKLWKELKVKYEFDISHQTVTGGDTRAESVQKGLDVVPDNTIVGIHDAVRPFMPQNIFKEGFDIVNEHGAVAPFIKVADSLRQVATDGSSVAVNRNEFVQVQTPQIFKSEIIKDAFAKLNQADADISDDVTVAEQAGYKVVLYPGHYEGIKITTPTDLEIAKTIWDSENLGILPPFVNNKKYY